MLLFRLISTEQRAFHGEPKVAYTLIQLLHVQIALRTRPTVFAQRREEGDHHNEADDESDYLTEKHQVFV